MSDWELVEEEHPHAQETTGILNTIGKGYLNYAGGSLRGIGQGLGDFGASALNAPISIAEMLSGKKIPHVPHPHFLHENPDSLGESIGQTVGQIGAGLGLPGGAATKGVQLIGKGYSALRAGKELPLVGKLLGAGISGAAEGALGNEENRMFGAGLGTLLGAGTQGVKSAYNLYKGIKSKNIAKGIAEEFERLGSHFNERFTEHLSAGEEAGANKFLRPERGAKVPLLKKAGEGKLAHGLEKFNENPTLGNAHKAQSDLNRIIAKYSRSKEGSLEADVYDEALKLKNRLLKNISEAFEKSGAKEHGLGYQQSRIDYAKEMAPYLDSKAIIGLLGKNKRGIQTIRPSQFADKLLQEEDFLAQAGHKHPDLLTREKINSLKKNHVAATLGAGLAGGAAAAFLPYEIRRILGH